MIAKSSDDNKTVVLNGDGLQFISGNGGENHASLSGISDNKGTSSDIAVSQKCLKDNYLPLSGGTLTGTLTATKFTGNGSGLTSIPAGQLTGTISSDRLPDLSSKYLPLTGGTLTGDLNFSKTDSTITGISDSKGTNSNLAASQKCLADNYLSLSGGTLTGTLKATKFTGDGSGLTSIPAEQLTGTVDAARLPDLSGKYLPISGGTITGDTTVMGSTGQYGIKFTNGDIQFLSDGGATVGGTITGISSSKGTSTTRAMSEKGVADNYLPLTGGAISNTLTIGANNASTVNTLILTNKTGTKTYFKPGYIEMWSEDEKAFPLLVVDSSGISINDGSSISGISDSLGSSPHIAASQKCLNDNYVAKSDLPSNLLKYQVINSTSDIGTDANTAYLILE